MEFATPIPAEGNLSVGSEAVDRVLRAMRQHLGMDVAFLSQFRTEDRVFRHVDAQGASPIQPGDTAPLLHGYCQRVVDGRLPEFISDTSTVKAAMDLPETLSIPIGAHLSVPIRLDDGTVYGTLCCFSFVADPSLGDRDLQMMRVLADLLADQVMQDRGRKRLREERVQRIQSVLSTGGLSTVYQPIYNLATNQISGFESLSRFDAEPKRPPNEWFAEADHVGIGEETEIEAIRVALRGLEHLPHGTYLSVNCSPATLLSDALLEALQPVDARRVVVEITEHVHVDDYTQLLERLALLRALGLRVAVDDAGAGHSSMRHIVNIRPDFIKLDISLTQHIDTDSTRRALASAMIAFARETHAKIVAEGIETEAELDALRRIGVFKAQGYYLCRPMTLDKVIALAEQLGVDSTGVTKVAADEGPALADPRARHG